MGLKDSLVSMMGDFVQMNKNPDYRSKTDLVPPTCAETTGRASPRRHSLSITVGTGITDNSVRQRTFSITPEMQQHLETINKRALKKGSGTADDSDPSLRPRIGSIGDKEDAELAARYRQRPRRRSEPVAMGLESIKEHKSSRKAHRSKDGGEEKKSRRKTSETSASRSRSGSKNSVTNSRKNSAAYNSKIDEEEDGAEDAEEGQRSFSQSAPAVRRLAHHSGSPASGPPATPIPEDWEAEHSHAEHYSRGAISLNPLVVELKNIEQEDHAKHQHSLSAKEKDADVAGGRKISCASRKNSMGTYPPPVALITNITRF